MQIVRRFGCGYDNPSDLRRKVADIDLDEQLKEPPPARLEPSAKPVPVPDERLSQYAGLYWKKDEERAKRILYKDGIAGVRKNSA